SQPDGERVEHDERPNPGRERGGRADRGIRGSDTRCTIHAAGGHGPAPRGERVVAPKPLLDAGYQSAGVQLSALARQVRIHDRADRYGLWQPQAQIVAISEHDQYTGTRLAQ